MSATSKTGRAALVAANGRARRPAEPPQGDLSHAEALRGGERRDLWFGEVPNGWEVRQIKFTFSERKQKGYPELPLLAATQNHGVILKNKYENRTVEAIKGLESLKLVEIGDFVISLRSFQGGLELAYDRGIISPAYTILMPTYITREYFKYYAKSPTFIALLRSTVTGIREGQNIDYNKLREYSIPIPPKETQLKVAAYLDAETGRIDKAIAAEEKMIALLQERREIVINEAVGGGDLSHAEAQRGRERRGWKMVPLKRIARLKGGAGFPVQKQGRTNEAIHFIKVNALASHIDPTRDYDTISYDEAKAMQAKVFPKGSIVFAKVGAALLLHRFEQLPFDSCIDNNMMGLFDISENLKWLRYALSLLDFNALVNPGAVPSVNQSQVGMMPIPLPPLPEQEAIVERLDRETGKIDRAIEVKRRQIELLRERRQIVIDEVVTGKVKVA